MASKRQKGSNGSNGSSGFRDDPPKGSNGHNSNRAERLSAMDTAIAKYCELQDQEDALLERHIEPIRKRKNKLKSDLKSVYGVPTEAFNARAALRRIEITGTDEVVLATNEMFEATPVGKNIDLVELAERVSKRAAEKAAKASKATVTEEAVA